MSSSDIRPLLAYCAHYVNHQLAGAPQPSRSELLAQQPSYALPHGCFVTWRRSDDYDLLGCIGCVDPRGRPLIEVAEEMAVAAATRDPRFPAVDTTELDQLSMTLTVLEPERSWPVPRDPGDLEIGIDGLSIELGQRRGLLLPQVAEEWGYDAEQFLEATCVKAGLDRDAWRREEVDVKRFRGHECSGEFRELCKRE